MICDADFLWLGFEIACDGGTLWRLDGKPYNRASGGGALGQGINFHGLQLQFYITCHCRLVYRDLLFLHRLLGGKLTRWRKGGMIVV